VPQPHLDKPSSPSGYLDALSFALLSAGTDRRMVEGEWAGVRAALLDFDVDKVAAMEDADVERLLRDGRMVRDRRKIRAVIDNAAKVARLDREYGGFDKYLRSFGSYDKAVAGLQRDFPFLSDTTAYYFLAAVGETAPDWEAQAPGEAPPAAPPTAG
jgi:3-methyladenine DNA glycosylase Tag